MRKRLTFSTLLLGIAVALLGVITGLTFSNLTEKRAALEQGVAYEIRTKHGTKSYSGDELRTMVQREEIWAPVMAGLAAVLLACALVALKWEAAGAWLGLLATVAAHAWLVVRMGLAEYQELSGIVFVGSILPLIPPVYLFLMRGNRVPPEPSPE